MVPKVGYENGKQIIQKKMPVNKIINTNKGDFEIISRDRRTIYAQNESIAVIIGASSANKQITSFDIAIRFDPKLVTYISSKSILGGYAITAQLTQNTLFITGYTKPGTTPNTTLNKTGLVELVFKANELGVTKFELVKGANPEASHMIDINNENILSENKVSHDVYIGTKYILTNKPVELSRDIRVVLSDAQWAAEDCYDCMNYMAILVTRNLEKKKLEFKLGGIAGLMPGVQKIFGYMFEANLDQKNSPILYVIPDIVTNSQQIEL